jgi:uncharacterized protein (DUF488 family)
VSEPAREIWTAGHGARSAGELTELLQGAGVRTLADVRRYPSSRRHPQHGRGALERSLAAAGIRYVWLGESLGGRREAVLAPEESPNRAWRIPAFRHFADAMHTPAFLAGFEELERIASAEPLSLLCAERLWWQCHRRLIADLLVVRGWRVLHLLDPARADPHELSPFARLDDHGRLTYPALA